MRKKVFGSLLLLCLIVGAVVFYQHMRMERLAARIDEQTYMLVRGYDTLVREHLEPLAGRHELNDAQERIVGHMERIRSGPDDAASFDERVRQINALQVALVNFAASAQSGSTLLRDTDFIEIQRQMSEQSDMRVLLEEYNTSAVRWNRMVQSDLGSAAAGIIGGGRSLLPYLRFDGEKEFVTIIDI